MENNSLGLRGHQLVDCIPYSQSRDAGATKGIVTVAFPILHYIIGQRCLGSLLFDLVYLIYFTYCIYDFLFYTIATNLEMYTKYSWVAHCLFNCIAIEDIVS